MHDAGYSHWMSNHQEASLKGENSTNKDDYIGIYKHAKQILSSLTSDRIKVWPTKMNGFSVRPVVGPKDGEITVLDTFSVSNFKSTKVSQRNLATRSANISILIKNRIEKEQSKIPKTPIFDELKNRIHSVDLEMKKRRFDSVPSSYYELVQIPGDAKSLINSSLDRHDENILISKFGIDFRTSDLQTLSSPNWLNDEVVNFYMQLILERSTFIESGLPSLHVFSTFFYPKLKDKGYDYVKSYTRRVNPSVLTKDLIFFPIHLGSHWCMAVIDFRKRSITYYDSLHGQNPLCLRILRNWLELESNNKLQKDFNFGGWVFENCKEYPAQQNGYDCGVFSLLCAEHLSRDAPLNYSQKDMLYWRSRIQYEILTGRLMR